MDHASVKNRDKRVFELAQAAAEQGHALAKDLLGKLFRDGVGVLQDYNQAEEQFIVAAHADNPDAMRNLALLYQDTNFKPTRRRSVARLLSNAVELGDRWAQYRLALSHLRGDMHGVEQDEALAFQMIQEAATGGLPEAQVQLGMIYAGKRFRTSLLLEPRFTHGPPAFAWVPEDRSRAVDLYKKAASAGHHHALVLLSQCYSKDCGFLYEGHGATRDLEKEKVLLQVAASDGSARAEFRLMFNDDMEAAKRRKWKDCWDWIVSFYGRICLSVPSLYLALRYFLRRALFFQLAWFETDNGDSESHEFSTKIDTTGMGGATRDLTKAFKQHRHTYNFMQQMHAPLSYVFTCEEPVMSTGRTFGSMYSVTFD